MKKIYSNIRGTSDFDVSESLVFREVCQKASRIFKIFGYQEIILPMLEEKGLFARGIGEVTDIVERQMFKIEGKDIVLRPEGTAQVIRYYLQNSLHKKGDFHKFFYIGPMFRGERPQKGRLRQFHHLGAEAIGSDSLYLDAEIVMLCLEILDKVGVKDKELKINSLGCAEDKRKFSEYIKKSLKAKRTMVCSTCATRSTHHALRVLDCKRPECRKVVHSLNLGQNSLCHPCQQQFSNLLSLLRDLGVKYTRVPTLVRGLDYYTNTVFEITSSKLGSQDAIGAGGRYNNLVSSLGGPDIGAVGFALGLERIFLLLKGSDFKQRIDIFVAVTGKPLLNEGFNILGELRRAGYSCDCDYCGKSLKGQLRFAQKRGARFSIIIGEDELKEDSVLLKDMDNSTQEKVKTKDLLSAVEVKIRRNSENA